MNKHIHSVIPDHALSLDDDLRIAVQAAALAGTEIQRGYGALHDVVEKAVSDLACEVDDAADTAILALLQRERPEDMVISEELAPTGAEDGRCWVIDPLDATSAFLFEAGERLPSVLIALRSFTTTIAAVVHFPLTGEWFYALRGRGAYKNGVRLSTAVLPTELKHTWVDLNHYGDASHETPEFARLRTRLRSCDGARLVTSLPPHSGIAMRIAEGTPRISAAIHDNAASQVKQAPWDTAAVQLVLEEAGGVFLNFRGERYDPFAPEPIIAASSMSLASQILRLLD